jgi:hypothetical protein
MTLELFQRAVLTRDFPGRPARPDPSFAARVAHP